MEPTSKMDKLFRVLKNISENTKLQIDNLNWKVKDLFPLFVKDCLLLVTGYEMIKSNKGATAEVDGKRLDGTGLKDMEEIRCAIKDYTWKPSRGRVTFVPKPNRPKLRPIGVQHPIAKIVQSAINIVLEAIYDDGAIFDRSVRFGWLKNRGCQKAMRNVEKQFRSVDWIIEGDIANFFPSINHNILIKLLEKRIDDRKFINLVRKILKLTMLIGGDSVPTKVGIPQGSITRPILANVYLHELDCFVKELEVEASEFNLFHGLTSEGARRRKYRSIKSRRGYLRKLLKNGKRTLNRREKFEIKRELFNLEVQGTSLPTTDKIFMPLRITYIRYGDDFIIGVNGPRSYAEQIKARIKNFLKLHLELDLHSEKTLLTRPTKDAVKFLGFEIRLSGNVHRTRVRNVCISGAKARRRTTSGMVQISPDHERIFSKMVSKGFCNRGRNGEYIPKFRTDWSHDEVHGIIDSYNATWRGIRNYYSGVNNKSVLYRVWYILLFSCQHTLAKKLNCTVGKIWKDYGDGAKSMLSTNIEYGEGKVHVISVSRGDLTKAGRKWMDGSKTKFKDLWSTRLYRLTKSKILYNKCAICELGPDVEMHHVDKLGKGFRREFNKNIKAKPKKRFKMFMIAINRKQIPVCHSCHVKVHNGTYDGVRLASLVRPDIAIW